MTKVTPVKPGVPLARWVPLCAGAALALGLAAISGDVRDFAGLRRDAPKPDAEDHATPAAGQALGGTIGASLAVLQYLDAPDPAHRRQLAASMAKLAESGEHQNAAAAPDQEIESLYRAYAGLGADLMARQDELHARVARIAATTDRLDAVLSRETRHGDSHAAVVATRLHHLGERLGYYLQSRNDAALERLDAARQELRAALRARTGSEWHAAASQESDALLAEVAEAATLARSRTGDVPRFIAMGERLDALLGPRARAHATAPGDAGWRWPLEALSAAGTLAAAGIVLGLIALGYPRLLRRRVERQIQSQLRQLTDQDPLTGLTSRTGFQERLDTALKTARRRDENIALLLIDLDGFKDINDSLGHDQGDRLLQAIARRLQDEVREIDVVARLGGDEFCLLLTNIGDGVRAADVAERCLDALAKPIDIGVMTIRPRGSVGIALHPLDAAAPQDLLKAADTAMYAAKRAGGHRYAFYEARMTQETERQLAAESALRAAVERGELEVHYQPKVDLANGRMRGVEALIRWRHAERGLVPPDEFVPLAERMGLIGEIGVWVLRAACRQVVAWQRGGLDGVTVAVNISPGHFEAPGFVDCVARVLDETGLAPGLLEIEVTESVTRDPKRHVAISGALRRLGVGIAIDDFGSGYSSLSVLKHMPVDTLKLDRQFVWHMLDDAQSSVLVGAIIAMARGLDLEIVAEGVETLEQVQVLKGLGCTLAQGYYFSRPVTGDRVPALARTRFLAPPVETAEPLARVAAAGGR